MLDSNLFSKNVHKSKSTHGYAGQYSNNVIIPYYHRDRTVLEIFFSKAMQRNIKIDLNRIFRLSGDH